MAESFVLTAQLQTQLHTASVRRTIGDLRRQLAGIDVKVKVTGAETIKKEMDAVKKKTKDATSVLQDFGKQGALAAKRFAAFSVATAGFVAFVSAIRNGIKEAIDFERQMIRISQVTGNSMNGLKGLRNEISNLATSLGVSSEKLVDISRILAQTGMSARDTKIALEALAKTELAPTFTNIEKTTEAAIAAMRQFNIEASKLSSVLGQMNALAGSFAVEADDLGVVIRRAGGAFKSAGGDLLELEALFTSVRSTTRESAETIATGFRTIFTRMRRPKTIEFLKDLGVNLEDMTGKFVGPYEAVRRLNAALSELDPRDTRYAQIIEELGGFRQVSKVIPLIQQFEKAELARATAMRGSTSLTKDALSAQDALAVRLIKLKEQFAELMRTFMDNRGIQLFIDISLRLAEALLKISDALVPLVPLLGVLGASALFKGAGKLASGARSGLGFNKGGMVPGVGNTDTVPAMLTPGEFVIRKSVAQRLGADQLNSMNRYAAGGVVRKGRHAYGTATINVGSPDKPKVGGLFMRPDETDKKTRQPKAMSIKTPSPLAISLVNKHLPEGSFFRKDTDKLEIKAPKGQYLVGPPESGKYADVIEKQLREDTKGTLNTVVDRLSKDSNGLIKKDKSSLNLAHLKMDHEAISGHMFEGIISGATGAKLSSKGDIWDYGPGGFNRSKLKPLFGPIDNSIVALDAKRNLSALSTINDKIKAGFTADKQSNLRLADLGISAGDIAFSAGKFGKIGKMNKGGVVDSVPALLTPGEFVINKASAQAIGYGNLKHVNKYAAGGIVRKGRGKYGPGGGGGGMSGLGIAGAAAAIASFASTLFEAETTLGKLTSSLVKLTTAFIAYNLIMSKASVRMKAFGVKQAGSGGLAAQLSSPHGPGMTTKTSWPGGVLGTRVVEAKGAQAAKARAIADKVGAKNAQMFGRTLQATGKIASKMAGNMRKFGKAALAVALVADMVGGLMKESGMAQLQATGGKSGAGMAMAGGTIGAAGMGAAMGSMILPVWGTAIGAAVGGLYGFATAASDVAKKLEQIRLGEAMDKFSSTFQNINMGFVEIGTVGPQLTGTLKELNLAMHGSAETQEQAKGAMKSSFPQYMKAINAFAKESGSMEDFFLKFDKRSLKMFASMNNLPYVKLRKSIENQIEANRLASESAKEAAEAVKKLADTERTLSITDRAIESAGARMKDFSRAVSAVSGKAKLAPADVLSRPTLLTGKEVGPGGRMEKQIDAIASILPKETVLEPARWAMGMMQQQRVPPPEITETTKDNIRALSKLESVIILTRQRLKTMVLKGKDAMDVFESELKKKVGKGKAFDSIMTGIRASFDDKSLKDAVLKDDRDKIKKAAEKDVSRRMETLKKLAKFINDSTKALQSAFAERTKLEQKIVVEVAKLAKLNEQRFATLKKARGKGGLTPEESERFFQARQAGTLRQVGEGGIAAGGKVNINELAARYRELGESIRKNKAVLGEWGQGLKAGENELQKRDRLADTIAQETSKREALGRVISDFTNVQQRTAALQERLNKINQDAAKRRGMVDQYLGATDETRAEMDRVAGMASRIASGTMMFEGVPEELRGQTLSFINEMAGMSGPLGDKFKKAAGQARIQQFEKMGIRLTEDDRRELMDQPTSEAEQIAKEIDKAFKQAIKLQQDAVIGGLQDQNTALSKAIDTLRHSIEEDLPRVFREEKVTEQSALLAEQVEHKAILQDQLAALNILAGTGVDVESAASVNQARRVLKNIGTQETAMFGGRIASSVIGERGTIGTIQDTTGAFSQGSVSDMLSELNPMTQFWRKMAPGAGAVSEGEVNEGWKQWMPEMSRQLLSGNWADMFQPTVTAEKAVDFLEHRKSRTAGQLTAGLVGQRGAEGKVITEQMLAESDAMKRFKSGKIDADTLFENLKKQGIITEEQEGLMSKFLQPFDKKITAIESAIGAGTAGKQNLGDLNDFVNAATNKLIKDMEKEGKEAEERLRRMVLGTMKPEDKKDESKVQETIQKFRDMTKEERDKILKIPEGATRTSVQESLKNTGKSIDELKNSIDRLNRELGNLPIPSASWSGGAGRMFASAASSAVSAISPNISAAMAGVGLITQKAISALERGSDPGSFYTHDTHVEAALVSTNGLLADILSALGSKSTSKSNGQTMPDFDAFAKSASGLSQTMTQFISAFQGGISWSIDAKHTIDINHNGAELFAELEGMIGKKMAATAITAISEYMKTNHPSLPTPTPSQVLGNK